jgi:hypothetical protein
MIRSRVIKTRNPLTKEVQHQHRKKAPMTAFGIRQKAKSPYWQVKDSHRVRRKNKEKVT